MIKVSVMYPNTTDIKFDIEYYKNTHLPMITAALGRCFKRNGICIRNWRSEFQEKKRPILL